MFGSSGLTAICPLSPPATAYQCCLGWIDRIDLSKGHQKNITAYPQMHDGVAPRDIKYRFQWNAPIRISPHDPDVLYHCSQYVHRSMDGGQSWEVISPDLTTNKDEYQNLPGDPVQHDHTGVELYTTIFAFEESSSEKGVLWAGTDDGRLHISRDNGTSWNEITPTGFPMEATINNIELSAHAKGRAFIAAYKYRENDFRPYIYMTNDYGTSWTLLTTDNGIPNNHFTRVIREDHVRKGLLYAGTEFGLYVSFNEGKNWQSLQLNLPRTPITDLALKNNDMVVATQGRSFWILDDLAPLQEIQPGMEQTDAYLYTPANTYRTQIRGFGGKAVPESKTRGVVTYFYLKDNLSKEDTIKIAFTNADESVIRTFSNKPDKKEAKMSANKGMNRLVWNMTLEPPEINPGSYFSLSYTGGPTVPPGPYSVTLRIGGSETQSQSFSILKDPRWEASNQDLQDQFDLTMEVLDMLDESHKYIKTIREVRGQINAITKRLEENEKYESLKVISDPILDSLRSIEQDLIQTKNESSQDPINYPPKLDDQIAYLYTTVNFQDSKPTEGISERKDDLRMELDLQKDRLQRVIENDVKRFEKFLNDNEIPFIVVDNSE